MRTGDARWWRQMDALAAHVADIDIYHTDADKAAYTTACSGRRCTTSMRTPQRIEGIRAAVDFPAAGRHRNTTMPAG